MKFLKYIFLFLLIIVVLVSVYLGTLDGKYDIRRTRNIAADPVVVYNDLNDYKNWQDWGPWFEQDSTIEVHYDTTTIGEKGAYSWTSDKEGGGKMKTLKVDPHKRLDQEIIFDTPFGEMKSEVYWILEKAETGTDLTWGIKGELPFISRFMVGSMVEQMGSMQERGLELLDESIQKKLKIYTIENSGVVDYSGGFYLYLTTSTKISEMDPKFQEMMQQIGKYVEVNNIRVTGSPFTIYHRYDPENGTTMFSVAYPIAERIITQKGSEVLTGFMERGKYHKTILKGSYYNSKLAWENAYGGVGNLTDFIVNEEGETFEIYVNNPDTTPNPADLITEIYIPVVHNDIMKQ